MFLLELGVASIFDIQCMAVSSLMIHSYLDMRDFSQQVRRKSFLNAMKLFLRMFYLFASKAGFFLQLDSLQYLERKLFTLQ